MLVQCKQSDVIVQCIRYSANDWKFECPGYALLERRVVSESRYFIFTHADCFLVFRERVNCDSMVRAASVTKQIMSAVKPSMRGLRALLQRLLIPHDGDGWSAAALLHVVEPIVAAAATCTFEPFGVHRGEVLSVTDTITQMLLGDGLGEEQVCT